MNEYFLLGNKEKQQVASAFAPEDVKLAHRLIDELNGVNELQFELRLVKLSIGKNGIVQSDDLSDMKEVWFDYQPNNLAWPFFSEKLKSVIEENLTGNEKLDWILAKVNGRNEQRLFYIPRFKEMLDVLDMQKTVFVQGTNRIIRPCFSVSKVSRYAIFHQPSAHNLWKITSELYVNEIIKKIIQKRKLTGISFEQVLVSD